MHQLKTNVITDKGGGGSLTPGQAKADSCWQRGGGGVYEPPNVADVICEQPLTHITWTV